MSIGRALLWFSVAPVGSGMVGYAFGFWKARPAINTLAIVGIVVAVVAAITMAVTVRAFLRSRSLHVSLNHLSVDARIGLVWSAVAIVVGINVGAFLGFAIGYRTAQSVSDILSGVGVVATLVASTAALIGVIYARRSRHIRGRLH